jgi:hypothetical protein
MIEAQYLVHCLPLRIDLVLKGMFPAHHSSQGGERLIFLQIGLFSKVEWNTCIS